MLRSRQPGNDPGRIVQISLLATSRQYCIIGPLMGMLAVVGIVLLTMPILLDPLPSPDVRRPLIFAWFDWYLSAGTAYRACHP